MVPFRHLLVYNPSRVIEFLNRHNLKMVFFGQFYQNHSLILFWWCKGVFVKIVPWTKLAVALLNMELISVKLVCQFAS